MMVTIHQTVLMLMMTTTAPLTHLMRSPLTQLKILTPTTMVLVTMLIQTMTTMANLTLMR